MFYTHEMEERKVNTNPMNLTWPFYQPLGDQGKKYLECRMLDANLAEENGWYLSEDAGDSYTRIVIPAVTHVTNHVYWQARDITGKSHLRYQSPKGPRLEAFVWVNPYGDAAGVVVVEGPMDALAAAQAGYIGIALMGMIPSLAVLMHVGAQLATDEPWRPTLVMLDRGEVANATRIAARLASIGMPARVVDPPSKDLASCPPVKRQRFLNQKFLSLFKLRSSPKRRKKEPRV